MEEWGQEDAAPGRQSWQLLLRQGTHMCGSEEAGGTVARGDNLFHQGHITIIVWFPDRVGTLCVQRLQLQDVQLGKSRGCTGSRL